MARPDGIVVGSAEVPPKRMAAMVNNSCGDKPAVIVMSACFSGQFVPALARDSRIVITAARPDRTSFGCGEMDQYTFFDDCFLRALPMGSDFCWPGRSDQAVRDGARERSEGGAAVRAASQRGLESGVHAAVEINSARRQTATIRGWS